MSWGVDLDPQESPYGNLLGDGWQEVEPGIFVHRDLVEPEPARLEAVPVTL